MDGDALGLNRDKRISLRTLIMLLTVSLYIRSLMNVEKRQERKYQVAHKII